MFGCGVAFEDAAFAAGLDVQIELTAIPASPGHCAWWMSSVAFEIAAGEIPALAWHASRLAAGI